MALVRTKGDAYLGNMPEIILGEMFWRKKDITSDEILDALQIKGGCIVNGDLLRQSLIFLCQQGSLSSTLSYPESGGLRIGYSLTKVGVNEAVDLRAKAQV